MWPLLLEPRIARTAWPSALPWIRGGLLLSGHHFEAPYTSLFLSVGTPYTGMWCANLSPFESHSVESFLSVRIETGALWMPSQEGDPLTSSLLARERGTTHAVQSTLPFSSLNRSITVRAPAFL